MTVEEFLENIKALKLPHHKMKFLPDLVELLEEYDEEKCRTLAGKIKAKLWPEDTGKLIAEIKDNIKKKAAKQFGGLPDDYTFI